ncbi:MAG: tetratricopeptide repeat protein [SAR324 cluster bacterium]|nr:tetratricopeptide repeat protein [SAR324 cluster bacterium]
MTKGLFEDELFSASSESSKCFLEEFKDSAAREEIFFLRAEALRKGGDLQGAIKAYDELKKNFPSSKTYLDNSMLQKGISLALTRNYTASIRTLKLLLLDFPTTKYRDEALYWLGYAASFQAESLRKKNNKDALLFYQESALHFVKVEPELLNLKQQQELLHLMGRSWWFLKDFTKAEEAWSQYLKNSKSIKPEQALNLKYQLATGFQQEKNYKKAERWFTRILTKHPDSKLSVVSAFLRAEMAYAVSVQETKTESLDSKAVSILIKHYKLYLNKNDNKYQALAYYRIGVLQQPHRPNEAIHAFQKYLSTKDKTYAAEVHYRLGYLFFNTKQQQKAIQIFEKYLRTKDKTYSNEVLYQLGFLYIESKRPKKAIQIFENYLSTKDKTYEGEVLYQLGFLYIEAKQQKKAIKIFEKYLSTKDKTYVGEVLFRLGYLYLETKQAENAVDSFKKYLSLKDKTHVGEVQYQLGFLFTERKQQKKAIKIFEKYLAGDNEEHREEIQLRLGYLYAENKQQKKAIKIFEKYLASGAVGHIAETQLSLGYLYVENKKPFLAIAVLEQVLLHPDYQKNNDLLQTLLVLYRENVSEEKYLQFLLKVKNDPKQGGKVQQGFKSQLIIEYFEQNKCDKLISELNPDYMQSIKKSNTKEWEHLLYMRGSCLIETKRWNEARIDLQQIRDTKKYREHSIPMLIETHKQLEDWKRMTWEYQEVYDRKTPVLTIADYQLWVFAAKQRKDFQRLERIKIIYERWEKAFPEDSQNLEQLNKYISGFRLQELTSQENWKEVSAYIKKEVQSGSVSLDEQYFSQLLFAENKLENWSGVLSAYALLRKHDQKRAKTLDALINQAKAADKLGEKELSLKYYRQALKVKPLNQEDKKRQAEIKTFLAQSSFRKWIEQGEWTKISKTIRKEVAENKRVLNDTNFDLLLYTENQKSGNKKYNGILDAYALLATYDKKKTLTVKAQIDQGYAAAKLGGYKRAKGYYRRALKKTPDKDVDLVLQLVGELKRLYERSKDYASLVVIYKRAYSVLKKSSRPKNESRTYAYLIGYHQSFHLKQNDKARIWLMRSDGGGSTPQELDAAFWVAKLDRDANKPGMAIKRLKELAGRKVAKNSSLYVQIHFELGTLYHLKEKWKSALLHYRLVAKARAPAELKQYQKTAKEKAKEISSYLKSLQSSEG